VEHEKVNGRHGLNFCAPVESIASAVEGESRFFAATLSTVFTGEESSLHATAARTKDGFRRFLKHHQIDIAVGVCFATKRYRCRFDTAYGNVGVRRSIDVRNVTTFALSAALLSVSTPPVPAERCVTFCNTSSSV
jgi:hypothetical protein